MNDYRIIYQNFIDLHKRNKAVNYRKLAFEDTAIFIALNEHDMSPLRAREMLNELMPEINAETKYSHKAVSAILPQPQMLRKKLTCQK